MLLHSDDPSLPPPLSLPHTHIHGHFQLLFILGLYMFYSFGMTLRSKHDSNYFQIKHMRLTTSHLRGAVNGNSSLAAPLSSSAVSSAGVQSLGVVYQGCPVESPRQEFSKGSSHYVSFAKQVRATGYSFRTLALPDTQHLDAVGFTVAVCTTKTNGSPLECPDEHWTNVSSSRCLWTIYGLTCINVKDGIYNTSASRDFEHIIPLTPSHTHTYNLLAHPFYIIVGSWGAVALALSGRHDAARRFSGLFCFVLNGLVNGASHAFELYLSDRKILSMVYPIVVQSINGLFLGLLILFAEGHLINTPAVPLFLTADLGCFLLDLLVVYKGNEYLTWMHLLSGWWAEPICMMNLWIVITFSRFYILRLARKDIQKDIKLYRIVWEDISRAMGESESAATDGRTQHDDTHVHTCTQLQLLSKTVLTISECISQQRLIATHSVSVSRSVRQSYTCRHSRGGEGSQEGGKDTDRGSQNEEIVDPFRLPMSNSGRMGSVGGVRSSAWCGLTFFFKEHRSSYSLQDTSPHQVCVCVCVRVCVCACVCVCLVWCLVGVSPRDLCVLSDMFQ